MSFTIIIPCFNEANRLPVKTYQKFIDNEKAVLLLFVNDGSNDNTLAILNTLASSHPSQIHVLNLTQNRGKAGAVQQGMLYAKKHFSTKKLAYLDADLSTSLEECLALSKKINKDTVFVFGSRILKTDNRIERKWYRFIIGRVIATVISKILGISVYDTQCGCKIFDVAVVPIAFTENFTSKWLFDVEIFYRLIHHFGKERFLGKTKEIPLKQWIDTEDSRVKMTYMFRLWVDLYLLNQRYRKK